MAGQSNGSHGATGRCVPWPLSCGTLQGRWSREVPLSPLVVFEDPAEPAYLEIVVIKNKNGNVLGSRESHPDSVFASQNRSYFSDKSMAPNV